MVAARECWARVAHRRSISVQQSPCSDSDMVQLSFLWRRQRLVPGRACHVFLGVLLFTWASFKSVPSLDRRGWRPEMGIRTRADLSHEICKLSHRAVVLHPRAWLSSAFHGVCIRAPQVCSRGWGSDCDSRGSFDTLQSVLVVVDCYGSCPLQGSANESGSSSSPTRRLPVPE